MTAYNNIIQRERDVLAWAWQSGENAAQRDANIAVAKIQAEASALLLVTLTLVVFLPHQVRSLDRLLLTQQITYSESKKVKHTMPEPGYNPNAVSSYYNPNKTTRPKLRPKGLGSRPSGTSRADRKGESAVFSAPKPAYSSNNNDNDNKSDKRLTPASALYSATATSLAESGARLSANKETRITPMGLYDQKNMQEMKTELEDYLRGVAVEDGIAADMADMAVPEVYTGETEDVTVKAGDTLTAIAKDKDVSLQELIDANPQIANPDMIRPGEKVAIPSRLPTTEERTAISNMKDGIAPKKFTVTDDTKSKSNLKSVQQALTDMGYDPNGVDGIMGGGTARALRKFQHANGLAITGKLNKDVADLLTSGNFNVYPDPPEPNAKPEDIFTTYNMSVYEDVIGSIESKNRYNIIGGSGNKYDGRYQMGEDAKKDAGRALGITIAHDTVSRRAFRNDPKLQDKAFKAYTELNHKELTRKSKKYRNMNAEEKLGILGYAHNQGATAAVEYLFTGQVGADAFNTKGTDYTDAIEKAFKP